MDKKLQGKKNRESGQRFERRVRADFESRGWIVDRWGNNVELSYLEIDENIVDDYHTKLVPAKSRFGLRTTGFPDFVCFKLMIDNLYEVYGVECKSNGYLSKEEKEKCKWLLENNVFSKILIASKGEKKGKIKYKEFKWVNHEKL